jgi:hypothetical protein
LYPATVEVLAFQLKAAECWTGATPAPDRETDVGDPVALLTIEMLPLAFPVTVGANVAVTVRFCEGDRVTGTATVPIEKPAPLALTCVIVTFEFPLFVSVTF